MKIWPRFLLLFHALAFLFAAAATSAQDSSRFSIGKIENAIERHEKFLSIKSTAVPSLFVGYGFISLSSGLLDDVDQGIKENIASYKVPFRTRADDWLQYGPVVMVYALDVAGVKSKHSFIDRSIVYTMAIIFSKQLVSKIKRATHELRPDESTYNSFPSGHTTNAFTGAEFMHQEYGSRSHWYSIVAYSMAAGHREFAGYE